MSHGFGSGCSGGGAELWTQPQSQSGFMLKRGETATSKFKRRFFQSTRSSGVLQYFSDTLKIQKGTIALDSVSLIERSDGHLISLHTPRRIWAFKAESADDATAWVRWLSKESGAKVSEKLEMHLVRENKLLRSKEGISLDGRPTGGPSCLVDEGGIWATRDMEPFEKEQIVVAVPKGSVVKSFDVQSLGSRSALSIKEMIEEGSAGEPGATLVKMKPYCVTETISVSTTATTFMLTISHSQTGRFAARSFGIYI